MSHRRASAWASPALSQLWAWIAQGPGEYRVRGPEKLLAGWLMKLDIWVLLLREINLCGMHSEAFACSVPDSSFERTRAYES